MTEEQFEALVVLIKGLGAIQHIRHMHPSDTQRSNSLKEQEIDILEQAAAILLDPEDDWTDLI